MRHYAMALASGLALAVVAGGHLTPVRAAEPMAAARVEHKAAPPQTRSFTGFIRAIDREARTVQVKVVFAQRTFVVPLDAPIATRRKLNARLDDLKPGDEVEIVYELRAGERVVRSMAQRGVTRRDHHDAWEREHLDKILTPTPSERGLE